MKIKERICYLDYWFCFFICSGWNFLYERGLEGLAFVLFILSIIMPFVLHGLLGWVVIPWILGCVGWFFFLAYIITFLRVLNITPVATIKGQEEEEEKTEGA